MGKRSVRVQGQDSLPPSFFLTVIERRRPSTHLPPPFSLNGFLPPTLRFLIFSHSSFSPPPFISREWEEEEDVFRYTLAKKEGKGRGLLTYFWLWRGLAALSRSLGGMRWLLRE